MATAQFCRNKIKSSRLSEVLRYRDSYIQRTTTEDEFQKYRIRLNTAFGIKLTHNKSKVFGEKFSLREVGRIFFHYNTKF